MTGWLTSLRAAVVALGVLAGLFAMHGLTHHGEHLPSHETTSHASSTLHGVADLTTATDDEPATGTHSSDGAAGAVGMCLAILLTGALLWSVVRRPRTGLLVRLPRAPALADRPRPTSRSHDPPTPWSLSVCRC